MKRIETPAAVESAMKLPGHEPVRPTSPELKKLLRPVVYTVSRGSNVFWPGKRAAKG